MLAIMHGKMLEMPLALETYRKGLAAIGSFGAFLAQPTAWEPHIPPKEHYAAAAATGAAEASPAAAAAHAAAVAEAKFKFT